MCIGREFIRWSIQEVPMQRNHPDWSPWFFLPPVSTPAQEFRRSNLVAIAILVFFAISLLVIAFVPRNTAGSSLATGHPQARVGSPAAPVHHIR
jgi:hypothetical protein